MAIIELIANERPGDRMVRCMKQVLFHGPLSFETTPEELAAFVNLPTVPVGYSQDKKLTFNSISSWKTNCAVAVRAAQGRCGRVMQPARNAQSIFQYIECAKQDRAWVPNNGINKPLPGDWFYVEPSRRLGYDHVGIFGPELALMVYETYEGGGGSGTRIAQGTRHLAGPDTYGRLISGWWRADVVLPASPIADDFTEFSGPTEPA